MQPFPNAPEGQEQAGNSRVGIMTLKALPKAMTRLSAMNKLQEVLQHQRDQLGKGTLPRDVWGRSWKKNQSKQRVQMLGRKMWLGERGGEKQ